MSKWPRFLSIAVIIIIILVGHYSEYKFFKISSEQEIFSDDSYQKRDEFEKQKIKYKAIIANDKHPIDSEQIDAMNFLGPLQDSSTQVVSLKWSNSANLKLRKNAVYGLSYFDDLESTKAFCLLSLDDNESIRSLVISQASNRNTENRVQFLKNILSAPMASKKSPPPKNTERLKLELLASTNPQVALEVIKKSTWLPREQVLAAMGFWQLRERAMIYTNPNDLRSSEDRKLLKNVLPKLLESTGENYFQERIKNMLTAINSISETNE